MSRYNQFEWVYSPSTRSYQYYKIPDEPVTFLNEEDPIVVLTMNQYDALKDWMVENDPHGVIRTDRKEDLKVIHRLLDVVENQSLKGSANDEG